MRQKAPTLNLSFIKSDKYRILEQLPIPVLLFSFCRPLSIFTKRAYGIAKTTL